MNIKKVTLSLIALLAIVFSNPNAALSQPCECVQGITINDTASGCTVLFDGSIAFDAQCHAVGSYTYLWKFGDGSSSGGASAGGHSLTSHTYDSSGTYTVCLIVSYTAGQYQCSDSLCVPITVNCDTCDCEDLEIRSTDILVPDTNNPYYVQFFNNINRPSCMTSLFWTWDFGDGNHDTVTITSFTTNTFAQNGRYYVCVTEYAITPSGDTCTDIYCDSIDVLSSFTWPNSFKTEKGVHAQVVNEAKELHAYPNPSEGIVSFSIPDLELSENATLEIHSLSGRLVKSIQVKPGSIQKLDLRELGAGVFTYRLIDKGEQLMIKKLLLK